MDEPSPRPPEAKGVGIGGGGGGGIYQHRRCHLQTGEARSEVDGERYPDIAVKGPDHRYRRQAEGGGEGEGGGEEALLAERTKPPEPTEEARQDNTYHSRGQRVHQNGTNGRSEAAAAAARGAAAERETGDIPFYYGKQEIGEENSAEAADGRAVQVSMGQRRACC